MRSHRSPVPYRALRALLGAVISLVMVCGLATAATAEPLDLEQAERERREAADRGRQLQQELAALLSRIEALHVAREEQQNEIERLERQIGDERTRADTARDRIAARSNQAYRLGTSGDPLISIFGGATVDEVADRARVLNQLAVENRRQHEHATAASTRGAALREQLQSANDALGERTDELAQHQDEAERKVAAAQAQVEQLDQDIANEKQRRAAAERRRAEREAAERAARQSEEASDADGSSGGSGADGGSGGSGADGAGGESGSGGDAGAGKVSGGIACPIGDPVNFSDTWGASRSGGRSHKGVDMLSPHGTPIYAYEAGVVTSTKSSSLGGISLILKGKSGNSYFYTHLSGHVSGITPNTRVSAGQHIAYNGASGNANGIPHLHFEVWPGGGAAVNPYPYAKRACG